MYFENDRKLSGAHAPEGHLAFFSYLEFSGLN